MLLNISNHPKSEWSNEQIAEAERLFGSIVDYPFPKIPPEWDSQQTESLANNIFNDIISGRSLQDLTVHIMGEMTFCYALIKKLQKIGIRCIASTTQRITTTQNNVIIKQFSFVRFREYT